MLCIFTDLSLVAVVQLLAVKLLPPLYNASVQLCNAGWPWPRPVDRLGSGKHHPGNTRQARETREAVQAREARETRQTRETRQAVQAREARETRETKVPREVGRLGM